MSKFKPVRIAGRWYAIVGEGEDAHVRMYGLEPPERADEGSSPAHGDICARVFRMAWQETLAWKELWKARALASEDAEDFIKDFIEDTRS